MSLKCIPQVVLILLWRCTSQRALYNSGELSHDEYMAWRYSQLAGTKQWKQMLQKLTSDLVHQDELAADMINSTLPDIYAENHNYGTYEMESGSGIDTTYTLDCQPSAYG